MRRRIPCSIFMDYYHQLTQLIGCSKVIFVLYGSIQVRNLQIIFKIVCVKDIWRVGHSLLLQVRIIIHIFWFFIETM